MLIKIIGIINKIQLQDMQPYTYTCTNAGIFHTNKVSNKYIWAFNLNSNSHYGLFKILSLLQWIS